MYVLMKIRMKKAFTLIEMLIVIVIIGILAAALIPRLLSVQGRARDTKRKADLQQIGSALAIYKIDNSGFPNISGSTWNSVVGYISGYLTAVPNDPLNTSTVAGDLAGGYLTGYGYIAVVRSGVSANGAILLAQTEGDGTSSNMVSTGLTAATDAGYIDGIVGGCGGKATKAAAFSWVGGACTTPATGLRYYYVQ